MRGAHHCERLSWRLAWLARVVAREIVRGRMGDQLLGNVWENMVFTAAKVTLPFLDVQGPGRGKLFGNYGASGMAAEIDTAIDDGHGVLSLVESKAFPDFSLRREASFIFAAKVQDHESARTFRWRGLHALIASSGRLDGIFCRWCFRQGIDVVDPDRFSLNVLARLPHILSRDEFAVLLDHHAYDWLGDILQMNRDERIDGPMLLRLPGRMAKLTESTLHDLNELQAKLSESVWTALAASALGEMDLEQRESLLLDRAYVEFQNLGLAIPFDPSAVESRVVRLPVLSSG